MGNKPARLQEPAPVSPPDHQEVGEDTDEPPTGGLRRADAWAIALAWRDELRGCVRLETDAERCGLQLIDSFEWITFVFDAKLDRGVVGMDSVEDKVVAARTATIAWSALSCCTGYSAGENPRFWRRIFSELCYHDDSQSNSDRSRWRVIRRPQRPITEVTAFFPTKDKPFPRVRLLPTAGQELVCLQALLAPRDTDSHSIKLAQILARLQPFFRSSRWRQQQIPVAVEEISAMHLSTFLQHDCPPHNVTQPDLANDLPHLRLSTVSLRSRDIYFPPISPTLLQEILDRTDANILIPTYTVRRCDPLYLHDETQRGRVRFSTLKPPRDQLGSLYPALLSALPHSQSATSVQFVTSGVTNTPHTSPSDWVWLGYAMFHPVATHSSSFTDLELRLPAPAYEQIAVVESMAVGNSLLIESSGNTGTCTTYEMGRVRATTTVHAEPHDGAEVLWTFLSETTLTLCATTNATLASLDEWVRAVIPGVGLGWIGRHNILDVTSHTPGACCLRRLRIDFDSGTAEHVDAMLRFLGLAGQSLEHLELHATLLMGTESVLAVLRLCPSLTSLRINHDGSCWADPASIRQTPSLPRLQQLELTLRDFAQRSVFGLQPLDSPHLDGLKTLRVVTSPEARFASNRTAFLLTLARYPRIQYAHHTNGNDSRHSWASKGYDEHQAQMLALLGPIQKGVHDIAQGPVRLDCCLAFLSVIHHLGTSETHRWAVLQRLDSELVRTILSFSTSPMRRDVLVEEY